MVRIEDFTMLNSDVEKMKGVEKDTITKDEFLNRFEILQGEIADQLKTRPTINQVKLVISGLDKKLGAQAESLSKQMEQIDRAMDILDSDLKSYDNLFKDVRIEMATKLDRNDGKKIWD